MSERRVCSVLKIHRNQYRYKSVKDEQAFLRMRIREIAETRVRFGYRRIHVLLRREGWSINHKRVYRLYCEDGLNLRKRRTKRHKCAARVPLADMPGALNECWAMDFVSDQLYNGRRFRVLTLIDLYSRECLALHVEKNITGEAVSNVLDGLKASRSLPRRIKVDNGPELTLSRELCK